MKLSKKLDKEHLKSELTLGTISVRQRAAVSPVESNFPAYATQPKNKV